MLFRSLRVWLGISYEAQGRYEDAIRELELGAKLFGGGAIGVGALAHAHAVSGNRTKAESLLRKLLDDAGPNLVEPFSVALIHAGLGDADQAFQWMESACENRAGLLCFVVLSEPRFAGLRADPRFSAVLRRLGL